MYVELLYLTIRILEHARALHTYIVRADTGEKSNPTGYW